MRVVLDTNIYISAMISSLGAPAKILQAWQDGKFDVVVTPAILAEVGRVARYPRIQAKYQLSEEKISRLFQLLGNIALVVEPTQTLSVITSDQSDNRYLEAAVTGEAEYVVSGDEHLLGLKEYQGVVILPPAGFLQLINLQSGEV